LISELTPEPDSTGGERKKNHISLLPYLIIDVIATFLGRSDVGPKLLTKTCNLKYE
jgi:hypothetical protein